MCECEEMEGGGKDADEGRRDTEGERFFFFKKRTRGIIFVTMVYSYQCLFISIYMHNILSRSQPRASPPRRLRLRDDILSDRLISKALHHLVRERKPRCFIETNTSGRLVNERAQRRSFFKKNSVFSVNVAASHFPTGHRIAAHLVHKEQREFANSLFPLGPN